MRTELRRGIITIGDNIINHLSVKVLNGKCFYRKVPSEGALIATGTLTAGTKYKVSLGTITETQGSFTLGTIFTSDGTGVASSTKKVTIQTTYPYMMFFFVTIPSDRDTANEFETAYLQINLYDKMENLSVLEYLMKQFKAQMIKGNFTLNSHVVDSITHQFDRDTVIDDVVQLISQYKIDLTVT